MTFFTADHHFWHRNILRYCNRPFDDIEQMNQALVEAHNAVVGDDDTVWFLGDFCFNDSKGRLLAQAMKGHKHLVLGNHDSKKIGRWEARGSVQNEATVKGAYLSHYPLTRWPGMKNVPLLHGHSHGQSKSVIPNAYDVGVHCWEFRPVTMGEILARHEWV